MPWKKGQSGNPRGRKAETDPAVVEVQTLAKAHTKRAIERLAFWMESDNAKASVSAASALLDRGHGKPHQQIDIDANVRNCDVSSQPLTPEQWTERFSADQLGAPGRTSTRPS